MQAHSRSFVAVRKDAGVHRLRSSGRFKAWWAFALVALLAVAAAVAYSLLLLVLVPF